VITPNTFQGISCLIQLQTVLAKGKLIFSTLVVPILTRGICETKGPFKGIAVHLPKFMNKYCGENDNYISRISEVQQLDGETGHITTEVYLNRNCVSATKLNSQLQA